MQNSRPPFQQPKQGQRVEGRGAELAPEPILQPSGFLSPGSALPDMSVFAEQTEGIPVTKDRDEEHSPAALRGVKSLKSKSEGGLGFRQVPPVIGVGSNIAGVAKMSLRQQRLTKNRQGDPERAFATCTADGGAMNLSTKKSGGLLSSLRSDNGSESRSNSFLTGWSSDGEQVTDSADGVGPSQDVTWSNNDVMNDLAEPRPTSSAPQYAGSAQPVALEAESPQADSPQNAEPVAPPPPLTLKERLALIKKRKQEQAAIRDDILGSLPPD